MIGFVQIVVFKISDDETNVSNVVDLKLILTQAVKVLTKSAHIQPILFERKWTCATQVILMLN
jgi:hypothetical protein